MAGMCSFLFETISISPSGEVASGYARSSGIASCFGTGGYGVLLLGPAVNISGAGGHAHGRYHIASGHSCVA